ncbi:hypothetical protein ABSL23_17415 (plasmid) [Halobacterium sp. NMX12-1]|uniref:Uncharacterized protein n=1 Tax=Halobacterium sp. NMX12-1 TaxID=3166650 RepID=A0AAU8CHG0_9EURY
MYFESDDLWESGEPAKSEEQRVLEFLENNPDALVTESFVATEVLDEADIPQPDMDLSREAEAMQREQAFIGAAKSQAMLERLVREGRVEKREIRIQDAMKKIDEDTGFTDDLPDELSEGGIPDYNDNTRPFYRIAEQ